MKYTATTLQGSTLPSKVDAREAIYKARYKKHLMYGVLGRLLNQHKSPLHDKYKLSTACCSQFLQEGGTIKSPYYCRHRWCIICNHVRTAILTNKYKPVVDTFDEPKFVTLTIASVHDREGLGDLLEEMIHAFRRATQRLRYHLKKDGRTFDAIRALEVTWNRGKGYHPHFHIVVDGADTAELLREYWIEWFGDAARVHQKPQHIRDVDKNSLLELFKYVTKGFNDDKQGNIELYPGYVLDTIYQCLYGKRTVQGYGKCFGVEVADDEFDIEVTKVAWKREFETILWDYVPEIRDYVDKETGELLIEKDDPRIASLDTLGQVVKTDTESASDDAEITPLSTPVEEIHARRDVGRSSAEGILLEHSTVGHQITLGKHKSMPTYVGYG